MTDKQVIDINRYKSKKQLAISNIELLDTLKKCFETGKLKETLIIAQLEDGKIGVLGNQIPKEKALQMINFVWNNSKYLDNIIE